MLAGTACARDEKGHGAAQLALPALADLAYTEPQRCEEVEERAGAEEEVVEHPQNNIARWWWQRRTLHGHGSTAIGRWRGSAHDHHRYGVCSVTLRGNWQVSSAVWDGLVSQENGRWRR